MFSSRSRVQGYVFGFAVSAGASTLRIYRKFQKGFGREIYGLQKKACVTFCGAPYGMAVFGRNREPLLAGNTGKRILRDFVGLPQRFSKKGL